MELLQKKPTFLSNYATVHRACRNRNRESIPVCNDCCWVGRCFYDHLWPIFWTAGIQSFYFFTWCCRLLYYINSTLFINQIPIGRKTSSQVRIAYWVVFLFYTWSSHVFHLPKGQGSVHLRQIHNWVFSFLLADSDACFGCEPAIIYTFKSNE